MRKVVLWILSLLAAASVLTTVSLALTLWLVGPADSATAPPTEQSAAKTPAPADQPSTTPNNTTAQGKGTTDSSTAPPLPAELTAAQQVALQFVQAAATGDATTSKSLVADCAPTQDVAPEALSESVQHFAPQIQGAGVLPGQPYVLGSCNATAQVLIWVTYELNEKTVFARYQVNLQHTKEQWQVTDLVGPIVPPKGYPLLEGAPVYDLHGDRVSSNSWEGHALLLVAPRQPNETLPADLERLRNKLEPLGVQVVLVLDLVSPADWDKYATSKGYKGDVWRLKDRIERIAAPESRPYLGCMGLLVDADGRVMAGFNALNPATYGLTGNPDDIAAQVLAAYHVQP